MVSDVAFIRQILSYSDGANEASIFKIPSSCAVGAE